MIKDLVLYCIALCCSSFALNNTFGLSPLRPFENFYKWKVTLFGELCGYFVL